MTLVELQQQLLNRQAIIVHCSRAGRGGETLGLPKPLFPDDLFETIRDLNLGGVREVSCSVVWPDHQATFGSVGIILSPRSVSAIARLHWTDAGSGAAGGYGKPFSREAVEMTFEKSTDEYNEWVLTEADVTGIFVNRTMPLEIARKLNFAQEMVAELPEHLRAGVPMSSVEPAPISTEEIANLFPRLPILAFEDGALVRLAEPLATEGKCLA